MRPLALDAPTLPARPAPALQPARAAPDAAPAATASPAVSPARAIACARCLEPVTSEAARVERGGAHVHARVNPHGFVFTFGCFADAPGARPDGEPTDEHTWFPGHAWRFALCAACGAHLGWLYTGASTFYGLILDRLVGGKPAG